MQRQADVNRAILLYYADTTILDAATHRYYGCGGGGGCEELAASNDTASEWYYNLDLSTLLEGEAESPGERVGQYGRYGCVLSETYHGVLDAATDIVLFHYEPDGLEAFLWELKAKTGARFREAEVDPLTVNELHLLSSVEPWAEGDEDNPEGPRVPGQPIRVETAYGLVHDVGTDVYGAMEWGRAHAKRLLDAS